MHTKDFEGWGILKKKLHLRDRLQVPSIKEREIWWTSVGINIGTEEDGHNELYNRPVLIVKKFNKNQFWGLPLTSKVKDRPFYFAIEFKGEKRCLILSQLRLYDTRRLKNAKAMLGTLSPEQFKEVIKKLTALLNEQQGL